MFCVDVVQVMNYKSKPEWPVIFVIIRLSGLDSWQIADFQVQDSATWNPSLLSKQCNKKGGRTLTRRVTPAPEFAQDNQRQLNNSFNAVEDRPMNKSTTTEGRTDAKRRRFETFTAPKSWGGAGLSADEAEERIETLERQLEDRTQ